MYEWISFSVDSRVQRISEHTEVVGFIGSDSLNTTTSINVGRLIRVTESTSFDEDLLLPVPSHFYPGRLIQ